RAVLDTMTRRAVLILGRFTEGRKALLDEIREALRRHQDGYIPLLFDFKELPQRGLAETIRVLAGLCRFVIADITEPHSVPHELATIIASYMIPIVPLLQHGHTEYSVLDSERVGRPWILYAVVYTPDAGLARDLDARVIAPALAAEAQILADRAAHVRRRPPTAAAEL